MKEVKGRRSPASSIRDQPLLSSLAGQADPKYGVKKRVTLIEPVKPAHLRGSVKNAVGPNGDMGSKVRGQGRPKSPGQGLQPVKPRKK